MKSVPYSCPICKDSGWPTAVVVFAPFEVPTCRYHDVPMTRSRFYDSEGNRIAKREADERAD